MTSGGQRLSTGLPGMDELLQGLIPGDNVVWRTQEEDFLVLAEDALLAEAGERGWPASYVTASTAPAELANRLGPRVAVLDARPQGRFADPAALEKMLVEGARRSPMSVAVIDDLGTLAGRWGSQRTLQFFGRTCPQLFDIGSIAYWRAPGRQLGSAFMEGVRRVTQCVVEVSADHIRVVKAEGRTGSVPGTLARYQITDGRLEVVPEAALGRLGRGLAQLRRERHLSQADLARIAGVTPSAISQAESGRRGLSLDTLLVIVEQVGISLDTLLSANPATGYVVVRHDRRVARDEVTPLLDGTGAGLRAFLVRLAPGESGAPPVPHKGVELVLVAGGLIQVDIGTESPVLRTGDALMARAEQILGWHNLLTGPAMLFWILHDQPG
jgi:transcriptional regulator with XRE-family HTH domain